MLEWGTRVSILVQRPSSCAKPLALGWLVYYSLRPGWGTLHVHMCVNSAVFRRPVFHWYPSSILGLKNLSTSSSPRLPELSGEGFDVEILYRAEWSKVSLHLISL